MGRENYKSDIAFIDLLFNILVGITFLFVVSFIMISPTKKHADIPTRAEFLVMLTWQDQNPDDVDLWVRDPNGRSIGWRRQSIGLMNYARDDRGAVTDTVIVDGKRIVVDTNKETVTIRGIMPGQFLVSAHLFSKHSDKGQPTTVTVQVIKVNPYRILYTQNAQLAEEGSVHNFYKFTVEENGTVTKIGRSLQSAVPIEGGKPQPQIDRSNASRLE